MRRRLFYKSWPDVHSGFVQSALQEVEQFDRREFLNPSLAGMLEKIARKYKLEVGRVSDNGIRADAREFKREVEDYGRRILVPVKVLDVVIPVTGNIESLNIAPSSRTLISADYELRGGTVILTVTDDERADSEIEQFIKQVNENLDRLREEVARYDGQVLAAITAAAEKRKVEIEQDARRDQNRKFPVRRA